MSKVRRGLWLELLFVLLVTAGALALRLYRLDEFPPGLFEDEAAYGMDALDVLKGHHAIFFERNNGREPLYIYLEALVMHWLGPTPYALRLTAALVGAATIPVFYWLVRTLFGGTNLSAPWLAGWAALLLATSYWHLALSRLGFRAITLPLVACLAFGFFWRALNRIEQKRLPWVDLILCGAFLGLSLYTYTASRTVPLVVAFTLFAGILWAVKPHLTWQRGLLALSVIALTALVLFVPLGLYMLNNWAVVSDRTSEVSIFNREIAAQGPLRAFGRTLLRTSLFFVSLPDSNLRHNPAQRPPFDWALSAWLLIGLMVSLRRWRNLVYLFSPLWFFLLSIPALLTYPASPHSLRTIGMLPAAYILITTGMMWAGERLPNRLAGLALWLPLPFLLFSATTGVYDYFAAWRNLEKFRGDFLVDYRHVGEAIAQYSSPESVWVMPRSPNFRLEYASPAFYTVNFFVRDQAGYGSVIFGEAQAPQQLAELTRNRRLLHVLQIRDSEFLARVALVFEDPKNLLSFLLHKHARLVHDEPPVDFGIPYTTYEVNPGAVYLFDQQPISTSISFDSRLQLVQLDYGRTVLDLAEPPAALTERRAPAGHELWAVLRWEPEIPIDYDLKTSLLLKDAAGHTVSQVDSLLVGDRYPVFRVWEVGERAGSYHILSIPPAIPPGEYGLYLKVYEDQSGQIYAAQDEAGQPLGAEVDLGKFAVTPGEVEPPLTPAQPLAEEQALAPALLLTGYDLPRTTVAPGDTLPLTLYWHAPQQPVADYAVRLELLDQRGSALVQRTAAPGNEGYPTTTWRAGERLRDWQDLALPRDLAAGDYELMVSVLAGEEVTGQFSLGPIQVQGRPRRFAAPPITTPAQATFGQQVQLLGATAPTALTAAPGETLTFDLVWQVQAAPTTPLVRFVHLLGEEGSPVAQQDTAPCLGECPATSWLPGEFLVDPVAVTLPPDLPAGNYRLAVGWYDPATFVRPAALNAQGEPLPNDVMLLPVTLAVE